MNLYVYSYNVLTSNTADALRLHLHCHEYMSECASMGDMCHPSNKL